MGQHKFNPNVQAAKNGELPPKKKKLSKRQERWWIFKTLEEELIEKKFDSNLPRYY